MMQEDSQLAKALCGLLAGEQQGLFHFLGESGTYMNARLAGLSSRLAQMVDRTRRNEAELVELIEGAGGVIPPAAVNMEMQTLGYLSAEFLLPRLIEARTQTVSRYERALAAADDEAAKVLSRHLAEYRADLGLLESFLVKP